MFHFYQLVCSFMLSMADYDARISGWMGMHIYDGVTTDTKAAHNPRLLNVLSGLTCRD